ncbi:MAG TPA: EAL domain-containing protein [Iamia sp.]|nr:EAL domain-containing protein [Iamia sp.]
MSAGKAAPVPGGRATTLPRAPGTGGHVTMARLAQLAVAVTSDAIFALDADWRFTFVNDAAEILLRRPRTGLLGAELWSSYPDLRHSTFGERYRAAAASQEATTFEAYYAPHGAWYEVRLYPHDDGLVVFLRDVEERHRLEEAREDLTRTTTSVLHALPIPTVLLAADGRIRRANQAWDDIPQAAGSCLAGEAPNYFTALEATIAGGLDQGRTALLADLRALVAGDVRIVSHDVSVEHEGETHWTQIQATRVEGSDDIVVTHLDVTDRIQAADVEARRARRDDLTGLPNRTRLLEELQVRLRDREVRPLAVLFLDLDGFKTVNDSLGHDVGDQLIRDVAAKLLAVVGEGELLARLGGDEFVLVVDAAVATERAEVVRRALRGPFDVAGLRLPLSVSVGIARAGADHERPEDVLRDADAAMYAAKASGRDRSHEFTGDLRVRAHDRLEVVEGLGRALRDDELELHYQPIADLRSGVVDGVEALMRWRHPRRGLLSPAAFIPAAEETGLIVDMSRWALHQAGRQAQEWRELGLDLAVGVNISAEHFTTGTLVDDVVDTLGATGLTASSLVLELTETSIARSYTEAVRQLHQLREIGVRIAIDDFGSGYSSLTRLASFPVDEIKFDGSLLRQCDDSHEAAVLRSIVRAVVAVAEAIGVQTLAEGIETDAQRGAAIEMGCRRAQGFLIARPQPADRLLALLTRG